MIYIQHYNSYVGVITLASDGDALTGLWFDGQKYFAGNIDDEIEEKDLPVFGVRGKTLCIKHRFSVV